MSRPGQSPSVSFFAFQDIITSIVGIFVLIVLIMVLELIETVAGLNRPVTMLISEESLQQMRDELSSLQAEYERLNAMILEHAGRNSLNREELAKQVQDTKQSVLMQIERVEQRISAAHQALAKAKVVESGLARKFDAMGAKIEELDKLGVETRKLDVQIASIVSDDTFVFRNTTREGRFLVIIDVERNGIEVADSEQATRFSWTGADRVHQFKRWLGTKSKSSLQVLIFLRPGGEQLLETIISQLESATLPYGFDVVGRSKTIRMEFEYP